MLDGDDSSGPRRLDALDLIVAAALGAAVMVPILYLWWKPGVATTSPVPDRTMPARSIYFRADRLFPEPGSPEFIQVEARCKRDTNGRLVLTWHAEFNEGRGVSWMYGEASAAGRVELRRLY